LNWRSATRSRRSSWWAAAWKAVGRAYHSQNSGTIKSKSIWMSALDCRNSAHLPFNCAETSTWWSSLPIVLFMLGATAVDAAIERAAMPICEGDDSSFQSCGARWVASSCHRRWVVVLFVRFFTPNVDSHLRWRRCKAEVRYSHNKIHLYSHMESTAILCYR
jgi:hypothetical protein